MKNNSQGTLSYPFTCQKLVRYGRTGHTGSAGLDYLSIVVNITFMHNVDKK